MEAYLLYLTYIAVILLFGLITAIIANKIKIPNVLILILLGMLLGNIKYKGLPWMSFDPIFISSIAILALALIVFEGARKFKMREFDTFSLKALKLVFVNLTINIIILSIAVYYILGLNSLWISIMFATIISGTAADVTLVIQRHIKHRIVELLNIESLLNTPIIVLIPFIILDLMRNIDINIINQFLEQITPFLQEIVTGIGAGILIGIIIFKSMRKAFSKKYSPIAIVVAALLTYILAENLGGNGVLAVTVLGLFIGNIYIKQKESVGVFSSQLSTFLEILVFVLVGLIIKIPLTGYFFLKSLGIFLIYLLLRLLSTYVLDTKKEKYSFKEKLFITMNSPKGIAVAVIVLTLATYPIYGLSKILDTLLAIILYSIILSTIVVKLSRYFIDIDAEKK